MAIGVTRATLVEVIRNEPLWKINFCKNKMKDMAKRAIYACLLLTTVVAARSLQGNLPDTEEAKGFNYSVLFGIMAGCVIPVMVMGSFDGVDNSPE